MDTLLELEPYSSKEFMNIDNSTISVEIAYTICVHWTHLLSYVNT